MERWSYRCHHRSCEYRAKGVCRSCLLCEQLVENYHPPQVLQKLFSLTREGKWEEARQLQGKLAIGEAILGAGGVAVHKVNLYIWNVAKLPS
jgi:hypothetical protein